MAGHSPGDVTEFERETWNRCAQNYQETFVPLTPTLGDLAPEPDSASRCPVREVRVTDVEANHLGNEVVAREVSRDNQAS